MAAERRVHEHNRKPKSGGKRRLTSSVCAHVQRMERRQEDGKKKGKGREATWSLGALPAIFISFFPLKEL